MAKTIAEYRKKLLPLTAERAHELLTYDPETGGLYWKVARGCRIGALAGTRTAEGYTQVEIDCRLYRAHRVIWLMMTGEWPKRLIDHKNKMRADNRWKNLREATHVQNSRNRQPGRANKSGTVGVYFVAASNKWGACIGVDNKTLCLGRYVEKQDAIDARKLAESLVYGDFAPSFSEAA